MTMEIIYEVKRNKKLTVEECTKTPNSQDTLHNKGLKRFEKAATDLRDRADLTDPDSDMVSGVPTGVRNGEPRALRTLTVR
jgi:hypothetical protein